MPRLQNALLIVLTSAVLCVLLASDGRTLTSLCVLLALDGQTLKSYTHKIEGARLMPAEVPININSTIVDDLVTIVHHPQTSEIAVHFQSDSRCTHPYLMGRLSGPLLSKLSWDELITETETNHAMNHLASNLTRVVTGRYQVPLSGRYFLEILVLMCDPVAQGTCLEDPARHRLTAKDAAIDITVADRTIDTTTDTTAAIGYWYSTLANASDHEPLYTRYQPPNCREGEAETPRCQAAINLSRFESYRFAFSGAHANLTQESLRRRVRKLSDHRKHTVCFVGASHARMLTRTSQTLLEDVVAVERVVVLLAEHVNQTTIDALVEKNCTKVVFGSGQHDAGRNAAMPGEKLTSFADYKRALGDAARWFTQPSPVSDKMDVVCRRTHYNPIGDEKQCLPKAHDWRNPPVIDRYNAILRTVCDRHGMKFLDTGAIMSPVWDSAEDWNHYKDEGSLHAEALYVLDQLF